MTREIKFRAWNKNFNEYDEVVSVNFGTRDIFLYGYGIADFSEVILEQYTGLKDMNGVEIYEGDIVEYAIDLRDVDSHVVTMKFVVSLELEEIHKLLTYLTHGAIFKVIGNIHENKDLLNGS